MPVQSPQGTPRQGKEEKRHLGWEAHSCGETDNVRSGKEFILAAAGEKGPRVTMAARCQALCHVGWIL